jgi:1-deoxy-D-xylulose-5-phosphate reductoisomerase
VTKPTPQAIEKRLIVLGSTGSIGTQTLDVVAHLNALADRGQSPIRFRIVGLATGKNADAMLAQAKRFNVRELALADTNGTGGTGGSSASATAPGIRLRTGPNAAEQLVREVECDIVLGAMVGVAGLPATLAAVNLGRDIALANKETLVAAGELVVPAAKRTGSKLFPVDSEHCAAWQAMSDVGCGMSDVPSNIHHPTSHIPHRAAPPFTCPPSITRLILTASGGPFRTASASATYNATREQALNHPTWQMGPKVTIDSASLTNKALEIVEAHWLFGLPGEKIGALVHPQSIVHALVEFADGNVIAQLAAPDMRTPIQYALTFPHRPEGVSRKLDWAAMSKLEFSPPDRERFPAIDAAYDIISRGGTAGAIFNAANEAAVEAFLAGKIPFGRITELSRAALDEVGVSPLRSLDDALAADAEARRCVNAHLHGAAQRTTKEPLAR